MFNKTNIIGLGVIIAIVLSVVGLVGGNQSVQDESTFGAVGTRFKYGITIGGVNSTNVANKITGTCALIVQAGNVTASTTAPYDCAVTGITSSYNVAFAQLATSTAWAAGQAGGFQVAGAKASTTAGYLTVLLYNATGGAANPSVLGYASTTAYNVMQTQ